MTKQFLLYVTAVILLSACATQLTEVGSKVRIISSADEASKCKLIKPIFATAQWRWDNATKMALNEAADAGANAFYLVSTTETDVVGNALICPPLKQ